MYGVLPHCLQQYFMARHGANINFNRLIDGVFKGVINDPINTNCNDIDNGAIMDKRKKILQLESLEWPREVSACRAGSG